MMDNVVSSKRTWLLRPCETVFELRSTTIRLDGGQAQAIQYSSGHGLWLPWPLWETALLPLQNRSSVPRAGEMIKTRTLEHLDI